MSRVLQTSCCSFFFLVSCMPFHRFVVHPRFHRPSDRVEVNAFLQKLIPINDHTALLNTSLKSSLVYLFWLSMPSVIHNPDIIAPTSITGKALYFLAIRAISCCTSNACPSRYQSSGGTSDGHGVMSPSNIKIQFECHRNLHPTHPSNLRQSNGDILK